MSTIYTGIVYQVQPSACGIHNIFMLEDFFKSEKYVGLLTIVDFYRAYQKFLPKLHRRQLDAFIL